MSSARLSLGAGLTLVVASLLSACTPLMQASGDTFKAALAGPVPLKLSREQVQSVPYDQLLLETRFGSAVLVLGRVEDGQQFWASASGQVLVAEHGLVRRTTGFPENLEGTHFVGSNPFASGLHRLPDGATAERIVDWGPGYRYGVRLHSRFQQLGRERIEVLGEAVEVLAIREQWTAPAAGLSGSNRHWVDPRDGTVLKSEQQLTSDLRVTLTALRLSPGSRLQ